MSLNREEKINHVTGFVGGCFKPFHKGHWLLVKTASAECDEVMVFVSLKDRKRDKDEHEISGEVMSEIWERFIIPIVPSNVKVQFSEQSPVKDIYVSLALVERSGTSNQKFVIYSDPDDMSRYTDKKLALFCPRFVREGLVSTRSIPRQLTNLISGTSMRRFVQQLQIDAFIKGLPEPLQDQGKEIWGLLTTS